MTEKKLLDYMDKTKVKLAEKKPERKPEPATPRFEDCRHFGNKRRACTIADCPRKYFKSAEGRLYINGISEEDMNQYSSLCEHRVYERSKQFSASFTDGKLVVSTPLLCPFPSNKGHMMLLASTSGDENAKVETEDMRVHIWSLHFGYYGRCHVKQSQELFRQIMDYSGEAIQKRTHRRTKIEIKNRNLVLILQLPKPKPSKTDSRFYTFAIDPGRHRTARGMDTSFIEFSLNWKPVGLTFYIEAEINRKLYHAQVKDPAAKKLMW
jgi:hypothetical protein